MGTMRGEEFRRARTIAVSAIKMSCKDPGITELVQRLTSCQSRLYAYIVTILLDPSQSEDVLQQTNLVIWEKAEEFAGCENFEARACKVAYFQALASRRNALRDHRRLLFDDQLLEKVAQRTSDRIGQMEHSYLATLRQCMKKLTAQQRELLDRRYEPGATVNNIAASRGEAPDTTSALLYRIRKKLLACIQEHVERDRTS
jgi:RNA polymerase sigma-70 factor, ECF subfamily